MSLNHDFKKIIFLPSGGLTYPPYAFIHNITNEITLLLYDKNSSNTHFEYMMQIVDKYVILPIKITELYLYDFYYIWSVLLSNEFNPDDKHVLSRQCNCGEKNMITLFFSDLKTNIYNKYQQKIINNTFTLDGVKFEFEPRKVKHNIDLQYYTMYDDIKNNIMSIIYFIATQTKNLKSEINYSENETEIFNHIISLNLKELLQVYDALIKYNETFGMENNIFYNCIKCKTKNKTKIYDDLQLCTFTVSDFNLSKKIDFIKNTLEFVQLKILTIDEMLKVPLKDTNEFQIALDQTKIMQKTLL